MKKKILLITTFLALAMLVTPIMAAPATKIEGVTITVVGGPPITYEGYPRFVSDGTISHARGESAADSTVTLFIPGRGTYVGDWYVEWRANGNWKKAALGMGQWVISSKNTMTFAEGMFVGVNQRRVTGENPMSPTAIIEDQTVWKGISGMFEGWTLKLTNNEGYVVIPK